MLHRKAQIRLVATHPEVCEPCGDSFALVDALLSDRANILSRNPTLCLEIGCGSGYIITSLALILHHDSGSYFANVHPTAHFIDTDINPYPHGLSAAFQTLAVAAHGLRSADLILSDLFNGLEDR